MRYTILDNGDLALLANNQDRSDLTNAIAQRGYYGAETEVSEAFRDQLTFIAPEAIGALTEAPIVTDEAEYPDDAEYGPTPYPDARVWWFPNYMVCDPWAELAHTGRVVFALVPKDE